MDYLFSESVDKEMGVFNEVAPSELNQLDPNMFNFELSGTTPRQVFSKNIRCLQLTDSGVGKFFQPVLNKLLLVIESLFNKPLNTFVVFHS